LYPQLLLYNDPVPNHAKPGTVRRLVGLALLTLLIVIFTIVRFWRHIPWSAR